MPQKRITASGTVRWVGRYRKPNGKEGSKSFATRREAKDWEDKQSLMVRQGAWTDEDAGKITLVDLAEQAAELATTDTTRTQHRYYARQLGELGTYPVGKITPRHVQLWVNQLLEGRPWEGGKPLSDGVVWNLALWVRGLLKELVRDKVLPSNPAEWMDLPQRERSVDVMEIPTRKQLLGLVAALETGAVVQVPDKKKGGTRAKRLSPQRTFARIVRLMAGTGMRPSEIAGLRWQDVDLDGGVIHVRVQATADGRAVKALKTASGRRRIPFGEDVAGALREQKASGMPGPEGAVFGTARGARWYASTLNSVWQKFAPAAGIGHLKLYSLRHFYASSLISAGVSVKAVSEVMGHKSPNITLQVYTHLMPGDMDSVRAAAGLRAPCGHEGVGGASNVVVLPGQRDIPG